MEHGKEMIRNMGLVMRILDESEQNMAEAENMGSGVEVASGAGAGVEVAQH